MRGFKGLLTALTITATAAALPALAQDNDRGSSRGSDRGSERASDRGDRDAYSGYRSSEATNDRLQRNVDQPSFRDRDPLMLRSEPLGRDRADYRNSRETNDRLIHEDGYYRRTGLIRSSEGDEPRRWYSEPDGEARVIRNPRYTVDERDSGLDSRLDRRVERAADSRVIEPQSLGFSREEDRIPYRSEILARRTGYTGRDYAIDRAYRNHWDRRDHDDFRGHVSFRHYSGYGRYYPAPYPYYVQRPFHRPYYGYRKYYPAPVYYYPAPYPYYCPPGLSVGFNFDF